MGVLFYKFSLFLYQLAIRIASFYSVKARLFIEGRKNLFSKLANHFNDYSGKTVWFHAASLGEFEQTKPLLEEFRNSHPNYKVLLTFFSPSGFEVRKDYEGADYISYLPFDSKNNAKKFIEISNPDIVFYAKYEFWYFFTKELVNKRIPLISFSAIFRKEQIYFKSYGGFYRKILKNFTWFFVQNAESKDLLNSINIDKLEVCGDTRFDRVIQTPKKFELIESFKMDRELMVIGSAWKEDLDVVDPLINSNEPAICFIIAPHEINESFLLEIENRIEKSFCRYSNYSASDHYEVLIIDNIGLLSSIYQYADYAFIGGAYRDGLHSILEAAVFGMPIFHGDKNYQKFNEASDLKALGVSHPIANSEQLILEFDNHRKGLNVYEQIHNYSVSYVQKNSGGTAKILIRIAQFLKE